MLPHYLEKLWNCNYVIVDVTAVFVNMVFSDEDKTLIKYLHQVKNDVVNE